MLEIQNKYSSTSHGMSNQVSKVRHRICNNKDAKCYKSGHAGCHGGRLQQELVLPEALGKPSQGKWHSRNLRGMETAKRREGPECFSYSSACQRNFLEEQRKTSTIEGQRQGSHGVEGL